MLDMKKILSLLLLFTTISIGTAQNSWGTLSREDYNTIQVINTQYSQSMRLTDIANQPVNGNWSQLGSLGVGLPSCSKELVDGNNCFIKKTGLEIYYNDGDDLGKFNMGYLTITNANFAFKIKGQLIKVGDDVAKLATVHQDAYRKRKKLRSQTLTDHQVLLHLEGTDVSISFRYDPRTNRITRIGFFQSLV